MSRSTLFEQDVSKAFQQTTKADNLYSFIVIDALWVIKYRLSLDLNEKDDKVNSLCHKHSLQPTYFPMNNGK